MEPEVGWSKYVLVRNGWSSGLLDPLQRRSGVAMSQVSTQVKRVNRRFDQRHNAIMLRNLIGENRSACPQMSLCMLYECTATAAPMPLN